jgi:Mitochondrial K+-H+ exchange-related
VKIYLLSVEGGRCIFYSEGPETVAESETTAPRGGVRGWAERKYKNLQAILTESEKGVGLRMRRAWEWLQKRISPDEPVLRSLRGARAIELYYPSTFAEEETRTLWRDYLKERQGRHTFWFVVNALVSPLTLLLAPLPGPNLIGYWFVYRAVCHLLARLGARNARSEQVTTSFVSTGALDNSFSATDDERIASLSSKFGLYGLDSFLKHMAAKRGRERRKTQRKATARAKSRIQKPEAGSQKG